MKKAVSVSRPSRIEGVSNFPASRLLHYSYLPIEQLRSVEQVTPNDGMKPRGLWVSVEGPDDWEWSAVAMVSTLARDS